MFTWICPQCGREVPPSYTECPDCAARAAQPPPADAPPTAAAPPEAVPAAVPRATHLEPVTVHHAAHGSHIPAWLLTLLFVFAFVGLGATIFWGINYYRGRNSGGGPVPVTLEHPGAKGAKPHPLQKYLEIAGMRFMGDKKGTEAKFLVVNHSEAEISRLAATITVWGRTQRSEEDAVGTVSFQIPDIGPNESKEVTAPINTRLKIYELPDWQNVSTDMQITSPPAQ